MSISIQIERFNEAIQCEDVSQRDSLFVEILGDIRNLLREDSATLDKDYIYSLGVMARGTLDYFHIQYALNSAEKWREKTEIIEMLWAKIHDCKDRVGIFSEYYTGSLLDEINQLVHYLLDIYRSDYGDGLYFSHDMKVDRWICTICEINIKACPHRSGKMYNGVMCRRKPEGMDLVAISIVKNPADMRCRLWPWNYNAENRKISGIFLTRFLMDDFIYETDWYERAKEFRVAIDACQ